MIGLLFLGPTLAGVWAQGDWKMAVVFGAALGVFPVVGLWFFALLLAKIGGRLTKEWSQKYLNEIQATSIPLGLFVMCGTLLGYCILCLLAMN